MEQPKGIGLKAFEGKDLVDYKDIAAAIGVEVKTVHGYHNRKLPDGTRRMPKSDKPGVWKADRQDLRDWVEGITRPGQGARTDLYEKYEQDER